MNRTRLILHALAVAALVLCAGGCAGGNRTEMEARGVFTPCAGECALLSVRTHTNGTAACAPFIRGWYDTVNAEQRFATMLTDAAAQAGLPVLHVWESLNALSDAGYEASLQPEPEDLSLFARALECDTYLEVDIEEWGYQHFFFMPTASLSFTITCRTAVDRTERWRISVDARRSGMTDLEIAPLVLAEVWELVSLKSGRQPVAEGAR